MKNELKLTKAKLSDADEIWKILQQAIERRKLDGSNQWQEGYPNFETVKSDIEKGIGYVLKYENSIAGYSAILPNDEPSYTEIEGKWLSNGDFLVVHRVAISNDFLGKGFAKKLFYLIEDLARQQNVYSIKVDTNFDNAAMLKILDSSGFQYCGEINVRGNSRKAFEKLLKK